MRDKKKPFVVYRRGPGSFTIVPRGVNGWAQFAVWLALLAPLAVWFASHVGPNDTESDFFSGVFLFCMAMIGWLVCGLWWMLARAEVIEVAVWKRDQQRKRRKRERQERAG